MSPKLISKRVYKTCETVEILAYAGSPQNLAVAQTSSNVAVENVLIADAYVMVAQIVETSLMKEVVVSRRE